MSRIKGSVAELGVYHGDFAKKINQVFPDRKLYLFDSFQGFSGEDVVLDVKNEYSSGSLDFSNNDVGLVLKKMKHPSNCEVIHSYFTDSAAKFDEQFVFVNIDTDLYEPIYNGLNYFYPRLVRGGYLFIQDFITNYTREQKPQVKNFVTRIKSVISL